MSKKEQWPFPELVDNTAMSGFEKCEKFGEYFSFERITGSAPNPHFHAGGAFASGLETTRRAFYQDNKDPEESMRLGLEAIIKFYGPVVFPPTRTGDKSLDNVIRALESYLRVYPLGSDPIKPLVTANGQAMVEFSFAIPTEFKHPVTGNPVLYGGRADMIGRLQDMLFVTDEKTTGSLGEQWAAQWDLDSQMTGYIHAARLFGFPVYGALLRGVGLLKTKITHAEAQVIRNQWEIDRWWEQLHYKLERMKRCWETGRFGYALSKSACAAYGGCDYALLCKSQKPEDWKPVHFRLNTWNPLEKDYGEHLLQNEELVRKLESPDLYVPELE